MEVALDHGALARVDPAAGSAPPGAGVLRCRLGQGSHVYGHDGAGVQELLATREPHIRLLMTHINTKQVNNKSFAMNNHKT